MILPKARIHSLLTFVFCFSSFSSLAQSSTIDQFRSSIYKTETSVNKALTELKKTKSDTTRIRQLNELAKYFINLSRTSANSGHERAVELLTEGVRLSDSLYNSSSPHRYESSMLLAQGYLLSNQQEAGEHLYRSVIKAYHLSGNKAAEAPAWFHFAFTLVALEPESEVERHKAISAYDSSIALYHELGDTQMEIFVGMESSYDLFRFGDLHAEDKLKLLADKSLSIGCMHLPMIYLYLARIMRYRGNLNNALPYSSAALNALRENGDTSRIASYYGEIALEYGELGRSEESVSYYKKCLYLREKFKVDQYLLYRTATLMTAEMIKDNRAAEGFTILKSLEARNPPHGEMEKAIIEHGMANCLAASGKFELAQKYYLSMIKEYQRNERNEEILLIASMDAVKFFVARGQFKTAETYHDQMIHLMPRTSIAKKSEIEFLLFKIDSAHSRLQEAIGHYQLFKNYNDSIFNKVKSEQIENLHIRYSSEQKDQNIALLTKQTELQQANLSQSEILRNSLLTGTVMLVLLLSLLYSRYRLRTKNNLLLQKQQDEISRKNFAQQLLLNEKDWLVREIHHRVKNNFHMVVGLMGTQSAYIKSSEALQALEDSKHRIHTMSLIHQKLYQSENLSATVMTDYIHELVSYLKDSFGIQNILFVVNCDRIELELSYSLPLGLILNEAVTNSLKYAFPNHKEGKITITLRQSSAENIQLIIADNGIGIPVRDDADLKSSMGLNLMAGLTEDISGVFSIKNQNGTVIQIDFPYEVMNKYTEHKMEATHQ